MELLNVNNEEAMDTSYDWFTEPGYRKRKIREDDEYDDSIRGSFSLDISRPILRPCFDPNVQRENSSATLIGNNKTLITNILRWLPDKSIRRFAAASKLWCESSYFHWRLKTRNSPFLLLWTTNFSQGGGSNIDWVQYFHKSLMNPDAPKDKNLSKVGHVLSFGTISLEENIPKGLPATLPNCLFALSNDLVFTTPDLGRTRLLKEFAGVNVLCIPDSTKLEILSFTMSPSNCLPSAKNGVNSYSDSMMKTFTMFPGKTLKGVLVLQYQNEDTVCDYLHQRLAWESANTGEQDVAVAGGIFQAVGLGSETSGSIASGWAIFGEPSDNVRILSVGVNFGTTNMEHFFNELKVFCNGQKGFALLFYYNLTTPLDEILNTFRTFLPSMPLMGLNSLDGLLLKAKLLPEMYGTLNSTQNKNPNDFIAPSDLEMVFFVVLY